MRNSSKNENKSPPNFANTHLKTSNLQKIRLQIDAVTKEKSWEVQLTNKITYKKLIDEKFLKENYEEDEPDYYERITTTPNVWHELPSGARVTTANLPKTEEDEDIGIYIPNAYKCAFANMANALYELQDYEVADFFVSHLNSDYETIISLINDDGGKGTKSQFMIAIHILQQRFRYKVTKLKKTDDLMTPTKKIPLNMSQFVEDMMTISMLYQLLKIAFMIVPIKRF